MLWHGVVWYGMVWYGESAHEVQQTAGVLENPETPRLLSYS